MRQASGIHLRARGDVTDGAAAHDTEPRFSGDFVHAPAVVARPPDAGGARIIPQPHQVSSHVPVGQQRSSAQTGAYGNENFYFSTLKLYKNISLVTREC